MNKHWVEQQMKMISRTGLSVLLAARFELRRRFAR